MLDRAWRTGSEGVGCSQSRAGLVRRVWLRCIRAAVLFFLFMLGTNSVSAAPLDVVVVTSGDTESYTAIARRIEQEVASKGLGRVRSISIGNVASLAAAGPRTVIIAVGLKATQAVLESSSDAPLISTLIPEAGFHAATTRAGKPSASAVYLDQPLARQLDLVRATQPGSMRVGVLLGPQSAALLPALQIEARRRGLQLNVAKISSESELFPALDGVLKDADVLLSVPDQLVFNPQTIPSVLFNAYRHRVPVIGFSQAYVRAGALAAVFSTPEQLADDVVDILARCVDNPRVLPPPQHPGRFSVVTNDQVARSLDLALDREETIAQRLRSREGKP